MPEDDALHRLMQSKRPRVPLRQDISTPKGLDANTSLSQDIEVDLPEVVRTTTRLEKSVDKALRQLCLEEGVTKEVWFEAAYLYLAEHPEALEAVNQLAQERQERRKRAADVKKLRTMHKRLSNDV